MAGIKKTEAIADENIIDPGAGEPPSFEESGYGGLLLVVNDYGVMGGSTTEGLAPAQVAERIGSRIDQNGLRAKI